MRLVLAWGLLAIVLLAPQAQRRARAHHEGPPPVAVIGGTLLVYVGETVYLSGTESHDPGGNSLSYRWTLVSSPPKSLAIISDSSDAHASFRADVEGTYQVELVVNNGFVDSGAAFANVVAIPHPYMW